MILTFASQQQYQDMVGQPTEQTAWTQADWADWAALGAFMQAFNQELLDSGELVETRGLSAPVHTRRIQLKEGAPVVTDGPYAEAEEVLPATGSWSAPASIGPPKSLPGSPAALAPSESGPAPMWMYGRSTNISRTSRAEQESAARDRG
jgi:hypothetical protein